MGNLLADLARHDAWALWLAAPAVGIALVCVGVWWWSRPARPATTPRSIAGHHAYLEALTRGPRERVDPPVVAAPASTAESSASAAGSAPAAGAGRPPVLDSDVLDGAAAEQAGAVTVHG